MAKKSKEARVQVILECTEQKASGVPGMSRYITTKNRKNTPDRLELMKYNPYLKKYTERLRTMAKKAVATLQTGNSGRAHSKCIKMVKSPKTGAYIFQEEIVVNENVNEFFK